SGAVVLPPCDDPHVVAPHPRLLAHPDVDRPPRTRPHTDRRSRPRREPVPSLVCAVEAAGQAAARVEGVTTAAPPSPTLWCNAARTAGTCRGPAVPRNCHTSSAHCASPVAPSGWPLEIKPPDGFTTHRPP